MYVQFYPNYPLMKAQNKAEKDRIKFRFAAALHKALKNSKLGSFRQLAKEAGMEPAHIQRISIGNLDLSLTKIIAISEALGLTFADLADLYVKLTESDLEDFFKSLETQKKIRGQSQRK
jgi:transcriptional regulator with XRE-family HTH domain